MAAESAAHFVEDAFLPCAIVDVARLDRRRLEAAAQTSEAPRGGAWWRANLTSSVKWPPHSSETSTSDSSRSGTTSTHESCRSVPDQALIIV